MEKFWNQMAQRYPRWDEVNLKRDVDFVLEWLKSEGLHFEGKSVFDIGCGTGAFAIPLAKLGASLTCIDPTKIMLDVLKEDSQGLEIFLFNDEMYSYKNDKKFDIVLTSLTPAIGSIGDFERFVSFSKDLCVYVGWGEYRDNSLHVELLDLLNLERSDGSGAMRVKDVEQVATEFDYECKSVYFEAGWSKNLEYNDAFIHLSSLLEKDGHVVDEDAIKKVLWNNKLEDNLILSTTKAQKGACYFRVAKS